jgi:acyl carrier protein
VIEDELIDYIGTEIAFERDHPIQLEDTLLEGALDSVDVLRLVVFVEERYHVTVTEDDLVPENFGTVSALADLLRAKGAS